MKRLTLFGSAVKGTFDGETSDVDFVDLSSIRNPYLAASIRRHLLDLYEAALIAGKTIDDYARDVPSRFGIERAFEVIGEAIRNVLDQQPEIAGRITDSSGINSFRNRIAHEYRGILSPVVWAIIDEELPVLRLEVAALLRELPPPEDGDLPA